MAKILFLAHRVPFPPEKGDKIRGFHMIRHLAERHEIWLGAGADDLDDVQRAEEARGLCRDVCIAPLGPLRRATNMALGAVAGTPLSVARFAHPRLDRWVSRVLRDVAPDLVIVFSSQMAQYVVGRLPPRTRLLVDFVDADAEKWRTYAKVKPPPMSWVYAAEFRRLVRFDGAALDAASFATVVSEAERQVMARLLPRGAAKVRVVPNGVDTDYFRPGPAPADGPRSVVFCGRMDYFPNIDGAVWFAREVLPRIRAQCPDTVFRIVGAAPAQAVAALVDLPGVEVTGRVADVRPYLHAAAAVVAPLRIARGLQNKVLEGMAVGRPVVATPAALQGIAARPGGEVLVGTDEETLAAAVIDVLLGRAPTGLGERARAFVLRRHQWPAQWALLDQLLEEAVNGGSGQDAA